MKVSIIIVTYDQLDMVTQCVHNLMASTQEFTDKEIILVDNNSPHPQALQNLSAQFKLRYIRNDKNYSFSYANSMAIDKTNSEYILLLNDDTIPLQDNWLSKLVKFADKSKQIGVVGCKLLFPNGSVQHSGIAFSQYRQPHHLFLGTEAEDPRTNVTKQCQAITFACALIRRSVYDQVGGLTKIEESPAYHYEDVDFCMKTRQAGYEVWYNHEVNVVHYSAQSYKTRQGGGDAKKWLPKFIDKWFLDIEHDDWKMELPPHNPAIVIGIPLADNCRWRFKQLMNMIDGLDYWKKNIYLVFGVSNCSQDFKEEIDIWAKLNISKYKDIFIPRNSKYLDGKMESVYFNRNHIREQFLKTNAEYLFFIDADVAMEKRTIRRLIDICELEGADISAGTYFYKSESRPKPMLFKTIIPTEKFSVLNMKDQQDISSSKRDRAIGLGNFKIARELMDGGTHEAGACNMGCTMIKRKCLEAIVFNPKPLYGTEDLSWFADAQEKGYKLKVDTSLKNFHLDANGFVYCLWNMDMQDDDYVYTLKTQKKKIEVDA